MEDGATKFISFSPGRRAKEPMLFTERLVALGLHTGTRSKYIGRNSRNVTGIIAAAVKGKRETGSFSVYWQRDHGETRPWKTGLHR